MEKKFGQRIGWLSLLIAWVFVTSMYGQAESSPTLKTTNEERYITPSTEYGKELGGWEYAQYKGNGSRVVSIGANGGKTQFNWGSLFGEFNDESTSTFTINVEGGTNVFDHQNIKFGSYYAVNGNAANVIVNFTNSNNTFTQRGSFGGIGGHISTGTIQNNTFTSGHSRVTFGDGANTTFSHNWLSFPSTKYYNGYSTPTPREQYNYNLVYSGAYFSALGNSETLSTKDTGKTQSEAGYGELYNDAEGYVRVKGVTFVDDLDEVNNLHDNQVKDCYVAVAAKTEGTTVTFTGAQGAGASTTFNVMAYFGGAYDLTTYGHISTSSDDNDVLFGGKNDVTFTGASQTTFNARTFIGAGNSESTIHFAGNSVTTFADRHDMGDQFWVAGNVDNKNWNQGYLLYHISEALAKNPSFVGDINNTYRGNDLPFVYLGGKSLTKTDQESFYYGQEDNAKMRDALYTDEVLTNEAGFSSRVEITDGASLNVYTSAFVGGADERWLAGDQYVEKNGVKEARFVWAGSADTHNTTGVTREGRSAIRQDEGVGTMDLTNGTLKLGNVNTYAVLGSDPSTVTYDYDYMYNYQRNRFEQVRMIGGAAGSEFNATGGHLMFKVARYHQAEAVAGSTSTLRNGTSLVNGSFFNDLEKNNGFDMNGDKVVIQNADGTDRNVDVLRTGLIAFDGIHLGSGVDVNASSLFQDKNIDWTAHGQEFFTNTALADTTDKNNGSVVYSKDSNGDETSIELGEGLEKSRDGDKVNVDKTRYEYFAYTLTIEDSDEDSDSNRDGKVDSNQARLHIVTEDPDEIFKEGNMKDNRETIEDILDEHDPEEISDAIDDILGTAHTDDEAHRGMDELMGSPYASMVNDKIRRLTSMNGMLANQMAANDVSRRSCQTTCCPDNGCGSGSSYQSRECHPWSTWGSFYGDNSNVQSRNGYTGYDSEYYGGIFGVEWNDCVGQHIGGYFNYGETNANFDSLYGGTGIESKDYSFGLYAKWLGFLGGGYGTLIGNITWGDYESNRWFNPGSDYGINTMSADYDSILPTLYYEKGWVFFPGKDCTINPFMALQYAYYNAEAFNETGYNAIGGNSNLALHVGDIDLHSLRTTVGLRLARDFYLGANNDHLMTLRLDGAWIHELLDHTTPIVLTSHDGYPEYPVWNVKGNSAGRDWANVGVGLDFNITRRLKALMDYDCFFNESIVTHGGAATLRFEF